MKTVHESVPYIEKLYAAFNGYDTWSQTFGCPCCISESDALPLLTKELRQLTKADISVYAENAVILWGDEDDFRHFLPRLFELCVFEDEVPVQCWWEIDIIVGFKLLQADWHRWSILEQSAIKEFLWDWWNDLIGRSGSSQMIYCFLLSFFYLELELTPFLRQWRLCLSETALTNVVDSWWMLNESGMLSESQTVELQSWLNEQQTIDWLEQGLQKFPSINCTAEILTALSSLKAKVRD